MNHKCHGFSLIELLVVVLIIAVLATVTITAFSSGRSRAIAKASSDIAGFCELARAHAMAKNTAVHVKLSFSNGSTVLEIYSKRPGESQVPLQRRKVFENVTTEFTEFIFNSRGELLDTNATPLQIKEILLEPPGPANPTDRITIRIAGLTGAVSVIQP